MDIKKTFIQGDHSNEYLFAVEWINGQIGGQEEEIQGAWVKRWRNLQDMESHFGDQLYQYADENTLDFLKFLGLLQAIMSDIYIRLYGATYDGGVFG